MEICPDFVAFLVGPAAGLADQDARVSRCGARLGWLIDPLERKVWVYRPGEQVETIEEPRMLTAGPLMPDFVLDLGLIWNPQV
jgi:Uma2 family endonuclease